MARWCGGAVARATAGDMTEDEAIEFLFGEITKRKLDSDEAALQTIEDGIRYGMREPLSPPKPPDFSIDPTTLDRLKQALKPALEQPLPSLLDVEEFFRIKTPEKKWLIERFIPAGYLTVLAGKAKAGKTVLSTNIIGRMHNQASVFNQRTFSRRTLYLDYENPTAYLQDTIQRAINPNGPECLKGKLFVSNQEVEQIGKLPAFITVDYIGGLIERYNPTDIWIDTIRRAFGRKPGLAEQWEIKSDAVDSLLDPFKLLVRQSGVNVNFLHHFNKTGTVSGSTEFLAIPDMLIMFERILKPGTLEKTNGVKLTFEGRLPTDLEPIALDYHDGQYEFVGSADQFFELHRDEHKKEIHQEICRVMEKERLPRTVIVGRINAANPKFNRSQISRAFSELKDKGIALYDEREYGHYLSDNWKMKLDILHSG